MKNLVDFIKESKTADMMQIVADIIPYRAEKNRLNIEDFKKALDEPNVIKKIINEINKEFHHKMKEDEVRNLAQQIFDNWPEFFTEE